MVCHSNLIRDSITTIAEEPANAPHIFTHTAPEIFSNNVPLSQGMLKKSAYGF